MIQIKGNYFALANISPPYWLFSTTASGLGLSRSYCSESEPERE